MAQNKSLRIQYVREELGGYYEQEERMNMRGEPMNSCLYKCRLLLLEQCYNEKTKGGFLDA